MFKPLRGTPLNLTHPLARGLVLALVMNEGAGDKVFDYSGYANHGTLTDMDAATDWVGGNRGWALDFDDSNDQVVMDDTPELRVTNSFAWCLWFKSNNTGQGACYITQSAFNRGSIIYEFVNDTIEFYALGYTGSNPRTGSQITVNDTNWHFLVYSYDGTTWAGYLDGVAIFSVTRTFSLSTSTTNVGVLIASSDTSDFFGGQVETVYLYNRGLSVGEIVQLYLNRYVMFGRRVSPGIFGTLAAAPPVTFDALLLAGD